MNFIVAPEHFSASWLSYSKQMIVRNKILRFCALLVAAGVFAIGAAQEAGWPQISERSTATRYLGISGMALWRTEGRAISYIVVHDAKPGDGDVPRIGVLTVSPGTPPAYVKLDWPKTIIPSNDLEAVSAVPGNANQFVALTSAGYIYHFRVTPAANIPRLEIVRDGVRVPALPAGANFEGFVIQKIGKSLIAVWADRGNGQRLAELIAATFDPATDTFGANPVSLGKVRVDYPRGTCVRHVSDLKIDTDANVFVSSARDCDDPRNARPFGSAVYRIGKLRFDKTTPQLILLDQPEKKFESAFYKIEALDCLPQSQGKFIFGTDDENDGGAVYVQW